MTHYLVVQMLKWGLIFIGLSLVSRKGQGQVPELIYEYEFADSCMCPNSVVVVGDSADLNPFSCADTQFTFTVLGMGQVYRFDLIKDGAKNKGFVTAYTYCIRGEEIKWKERKKVTGLKVIGEMRWELQINKTLLEKPFCDSLWAYVLELEIDSLPTDDELMNEVGYIQIHGTHFDCVLTLNGVQKDYATNRLYLDSSQALAAFQPIRSMVLSYLDSHPKASVPYELHAHYNDRHSSGSIYTGSVEPKIYGPLEFDWSDTFFDY